MRILILDFITSVGGVQSVYRNIVPYIASKHKVFFLDPYGNAFDEEIGGIVNVEKISMPIKSVSRLGWDASASRKLIIILKYGLEYLTYLFKLRKLIMDKAIDLVYVGGKKALIITYILSKIVKIKYLYHAHGFESYLDIDKIFKLAIREARLVIAVSNDVKKKLLQAEIREEMICVVHNGIVINSLPAKEFEQLNNRRLTVVFIGSIQPQKGIHILVDAVIRLINERYNIELLIVGEVAASVHANYHTMLLDTSKAYRDHILFTGFARDVYDTIAKADVLVLPSLEESFGMVLLEAMLHSRPVVGSNVGGIPEVITDGYNGFLFERGNSEQLADKIRILYSNPELRKRMGDNGNELLRRKFNSEIQSTMILELVHKMAQI